MRNNSGTGTMFYKTDTGSSTNWLGVADTTTVNEIDANVDDLITLSGVSENATDLGTFTGATIPDSRTVKVALQDVETAYEETDANADDLITLSGVAEQATDLGTFTGSTIADSETIKGALQDAEDGIEAINDEITYDASDNIYLADEVPPSLSGAVDNILLNQDGVNLGITSGDDNICIGSDTCETITSESDAVCIGEGACRQMAPSNGVVYIGAGAGENMLHTGDANVIIGSFAGYQNQGQNNTYLGFQSGRNPTSSSHDGNTYVGAYSGWGANGANNLILGSLVAYNGGAGNITLDDAFLADAWSDCGRLGGLSTRCFLEGDMSTGDLRVENSVGAANSGTLRIYETDANGSDYIQFDGPDSITATRTITVGDEDADLTQIPDLVTLSGVSANATNLGTFTGDTISDNEEIKDALQELETAVETKNDSITCTTDTAVLSDWDQSPFSCSDNTWCNITSRSLAAGTYIIHAHAYFNVDNVLQSSGEIYTAITTDSGTTTTDHTPGDNEVADYNSGASSERTTISMTYVKTLGSTTTMYYKAYTADATYLELAYAVRWCKISD